MKFQMFKLDLEEAEEPEINCQHLVDHQKSKRIPGKKKIYFCFIDYAKAFDCVDHNKLGKFWKRWEYQNTWPASWEICMQVKKQHLELDMEQQIDYKSGKENVKAVYCHPVYLILYAEYIMWNARLDEVQAEIKIAERNISNLRYADNTNLMAKAQKN